MPNGNRAGQQRDFHVEQTNIVRIVLIDVSAIWQAIKRDDLL